MPVISQEDSEIDSRIEIVDSGIIEVTEGANDGEDGDDEGDDEYEGNS